MKPDCKLVVIAVEGGLIRDIQGIPTGLVVEIRDYDVDGRDPHELDKD